MNLLRKPLVHALLGLGLLTSGQAFAQVSATANTNVVINFPEILVLYTFSDVSLTLDATDIQGQLGLGSTVACVAGSFCVNAGSTSEVAVTATTDLDIAGDADVPADAALTDATLTLQNAYGARSLGLTDANYTVGVVDGATTDVLGVGAGQATSFANTGLALSTGDLELSIDASEIDTQAEAASVTETFAITVSGT